MPDSLADHKDFLTAKGARAIADHINTYWREQGVAGIVAYPVQRLGSDGEWDVRSNMVDGKPPVILGENLLRGTMRVRA